MSSSHFNFIPVTLPFKRFNQIYLHVAALLLSAVCVAQPGIDNVQLLNKTVGQYEKAEWNIRITGQFINPFNQKEVALDMLLTSPSGKPLLLPCYFEKDNLWKARFAPQETGKYEYVFRLTSKAGSQESPSGTFVSLPTNKAGFLHKNDLWTFKFDNGKLFRAIGENVGWESRSFEKDKWTYDYLLPTLANNGANFFRTWMCSWNMPLEWKKVNSTKRYSNTDEYFNPGAIRRMDELMNMCDSLGLYFMLTLDWHGHLMRDGAWANSNYNVLNGGPAKDPSDFFTMQSAMEKYKNKLRYVVARWGYSSSVAVWEFFNEVDNAAFTSQDSIIISPAVIAQWHLEMSRYLKDIDPYKHLVSTSVSHRDIIGMNSIPYIDFNQKHIYKRTEKIPAIYPDYIQTFGKPYVIGEFGYRWEDDDPKYGESWDYDYKRGLWYGLFQPTPILPMTWWWELFDDRKMTPYFRSVRKISDRMLQIGKGSFEPVSVSAGRLEAYALKCGKEYYIYLLNNTTSPITADVELKVNDGGSFVLQKYNLSTLTFDPMKNFAYSNKTVTIKQVNLPARMEGVFIISKNPAGKSKQSIASLLR